MRVCPKVRGISRAAWAFGQTEAMCESTLFWVKGAITRGRSYLAPNAIMVELRYMQTSGQTSLHTPITMA